MPSSAAQQNIWKQMNYTPPRGPCNHKESLLSPKCPCLRFMLHPLKVTSSFTCDGCNHHASFHSMSSPADDAAIARWASEPTGPATSASHPSDAPRSRKRPRRALLEAGPSATNAAAAAAAAAPADVDLSSLFGEDAESIAGAEAAAARGPGGRQGGKTWGDRFSSWSFGGRAGEEPVKTPPKRQHAVAIVGNGVGGGGGGGGGSRTRRNRRREQDEDGGEFVGSDVVDLD